LGEFLERSASHLLIALTDAERSLALERFQVIRPFFEEGTPVSQIAKDRGIPLRTAQRWVMDYRLQGIAGLARKSRGDKNHPRRATSLLQIVEGLALQKPRVSVATLYRNVVEAAEKLGQKPPSYLHSANGGGAFWANYGCRQLRP
jgi:putative transposase